MPKGVYKHGKMSEGHKNKIRLGNKGKPKSEIHKKHIKDAWLDGKYTEETRKKQRESKIGEKNPMFGKKLTQKQIDDLKVYSKSPESRQKKREWSIANPNRKFKETSIEIKVETELKRRGIVYEKQVPLCKIAIVDFYLPGYRMVIQCDGCYWHNCPTCKRSDIKGATEKDKRQDLVLTFNGFNVYRFWEHEINKSVEECINRINLI